MNITSSLEANVCQEDTYQYCQEQLENRPATIRCLRNHIHELRSDCRKFLRAQRNETLRGRGWRRECHREIRRWCPRLADAQACLRAKKKLLSQNCQQSLEAENL